MARYSRPFVASPVHTLAVAATVCGLLLAACANASSQDAPATQAAQAHANAATLQAARAQEAAERAAQLHAAGVGSQAAAAAALEDARKAADEARLAQVAAQQMAAELAAAAQLAESARTSVVAPVAGNPQQTANAVMSALDGRVRVTPAGSSVVISGPPQLVEEAQALLDQLNQRESEQDMRNQAEADKARSLESMRPATRLFDVTFGPTLGDTLKALSMSVGDGTSEGLNIVFASGADGSKFPVRTVELHRVGLQSAIQTLQAMMLNASGRPIVEIDLGSIRATGERPVVTVTAPRHRGSGDDGTVYQVAVFRLRSIDTAASPESRTEVATEHANLLEAIDVGLEIVGRSPEFKIKLHPATGMMFVHGLRPEIRVVAEVLGEPDPTTTPAQATPAPASSSATAAAEAAAAQSPRPAGSGK